MKNLPLLRVLTLFLGLSITASFPLFSQGEMIVSQRILYPELVNPSALGMDEELSLLSVYKLSQQQMEGSPKLLSMVARVPLLSNLGVGLKLDSESIGYRNMLRFGFSGDVTIPLAEEHWLTAGLGLGLESRSFEPIASDIFDPQINLINTADYERINFMQQFGLTYHWRDLTAGVGNIYIKRADEKLNLDNLTSIYMHAAYQIALPLDFSISPKIFLEYNSDFGFSTDLALFGSYREFGSLGVSYRVGKSVAAMIRVNILQYASIGYCCEFNTGKYANLFNNMHEISLRINYAAWYLSHK